MSGLTLAPSENLKNKVNLPNINEKGLKNRDYKNHTKNVKPKNRAASFIDAANVQKYLVPYFY